MKIIKVIIAIFAVFVLGSVALGLLGGLMGMTVGLLGALWGIVKAVFGIVKGIVFHPVVIALIVIFIVVKIHDRTPAK